MPAITGHVTLNGVTEQQIEFVLGFRQKHTTFSFALNTLQPIANKAGSYNNCTFGWNSEEGMKEAYELTHKLVHGAESTPRHQ